MSVGGVRTGERVLDLAGGTGDLTSRLLPLVGPKGGVVLSDINASMLGEGRERLIDEGVVGNIAYAQADAEQLPFPTTPSIASPSASACATSPARNGRWRRCIARSSRADGHHPGVFPSGRARFEARL